MYPKMDHMEPELMKNMAAFPVSSVAQNGESPLKSHVLDILSMFLLEFWAEILTTEYVTYKLSENTKIGSKYWVNNF